MPALWDCLRYKHALPYIARGCKINDFTHVMSLIKPANSQHFLGNTVDASNLQSHATSSKATAMLNTAASPQLVDWNLVGHAIALRQKDPGALSDVHSIQMLQRKCCTQSRQATRSRHSTLTGWRNACQLRWSFAARLK